MPGTWTWPEPEPVIGARLSDRAGSAAMPGASETVTVMFADVAGSEALPERFGEERYLALLASYEAQRHLGADRRR